MDTEFFYACADRMLDLIDRRATDLAPAVMYESTELYADQEHLDKERAAIFATGPLFLGLTADIPSPGSWRALDVVDSPLLLSRDEQNQPRLFLNSCRHRGVKLCTGAGSGRRNFTCPFHAWRYDLQGNLINVPEPEGFDDLVRADHGLIELPVAEKYGMLFGSPVPGPAIDVDEALGGLGPELAGWHFENFSLHTEPHPHPFRGNWKSAWDTFCENYHFAFLHQNTLKDYLVSRRQAVDFYGPHVKMISALRSIEQMRKQPREEWDPARHVSIQYRLFPAVNFSVYPEKVEVHWIYPGRIPEEGNGVHAVYLREEPTDDEELKKLEEAIRFGCEDIVDAEDFWVTSQTIPGMRAPARQPHLVFGRNEPAVQHFHRQFTEAVARYEKERTTP